MKTEYSPEDIVRASDWYHAHWHHVNALMKGSNQSYPASGSDIARPEMWKPGHWNYFFKKRDAHL